MNRTGKIILLNAFVFCISANQLLLAQEEQASKLPPQATEVWEPEPPAITPGKTSADAPSDAIVLFNGSDLSAWQSAKDGSFAPWNVADGTFTVKPGSGGIKTRQKFGDVQLHIEWKAPAEIKGEGQKRGNSGVFLMGRYEVQILDSYNNRTYSNGQASSVYKQHIPLVNAMRSPSEWQTYDIIFMAPRFNKDGMVVKPATVTVLHNGVLTQNHVEIKGPTTFRGLPKYEVHEDKLPIELQDHSNPVSFRNIWVREL